MKYALSSLALALFVAGAINYHNVSQFGFPDGHITQYEAAAKPVLTAVSILQLASILPLIAVTLRGLPGNATRRLLIVGALFLILSLLLQYGFVPIFYRDYLQLDSGQGG